MLAKSRAGLSSGRNSKPHPEGSRGLGNVHPSISRSPSRPSCGVESLTPTPEEASAPEFLEPGLGSPWSKQTQANSRSVLWGHLMPCWILYFCFLLFIQDVISNSLRPHGLKHARLPCVSLFPRVCSDSCLLSQWCHPTIASSVAPFSSCPQSFPASGSFPGSMPVIQPKYLNGNFQSQMYLLMFTKLPGWSYKIPLREIFWLESIGFSSDFAATERRALCSFFIFKCLTFVRGVQAWGIRDTGLPSGSSPPFSPCPKSTPPTQLSGKVQRFSRHVGWLSGVNSLGLSHWDQTKDASCHRLPKLSTMSFMKPRKYWIRIHKDCGCRCPAGRKVGNGKQSWPLSAKRGSGRGMWEAAACRRQLPRRAVLRNVSKRHISRPLRHCPCMIQEQSHL